MTQQQLEEVMKYHLSNFNDEGVEISNSTLHNEVLSDTDGYGNANSKSIYKAVMRWTLQKNGLDDRPWPANWIEMDVSDLAINLLTTP
ncbi:MAG: hypothetical protein H6605_01775 [Flavobacteriales bacterium]|nr:hypothetical protein [Flavobacteriales bacterium]